MIRVLIADDEQPARQRLRQLLAAHTCEVVGEAATGAEAMALIAATAPDVLFLDIDMPQGNGLDVAASLPSSNTRIVFCTAYDEHAVDAFELNALDYLLKPVNRSRLAKTWARLTAAMQLAQTSRKEEPSTKPNASRFVVRCGSRYAVVPVNDVLRFDSIDGLTRLTTHAGKQFWIDAPLNEIEPRLESSQMFRVSRAVLIRTSAVTVVHPLPGGNATAELKNGDRVDVSRRRVQSFLERIENS